MQLDEQRAQVADGAAQALDRRAEHIRLAARPACCRLVGQRREREREAGDLLHRPVVEIRGDPAAFPRRRRDRVPEQRLALLVPALEPARQRPDERSLDQHDQPDRAEDRRRERREQAPRARRDRAEALVDLEQHRRARRRPDPRVRLDQLALPAVERVLGPAEVAHLHLRAALAQKPRADPRRARSGRRSGPDRPSRGRGRPPTRSSPARSSCSARARRRRRPRLRPPPACP